MAKQYLHHVIISICIDIVFFKCFKSEEFTYTLSVQCLETPCGQEELFPIRSRLACASICSRSDSCLGFSYTSDGLCVLLQDGCTGSNACSSGQSSVEVYTKQKILCKNKGEWKSQLQTCKCVNGWVGTFCQRYAYSCKELTSFNYTIGIHRVYIDVFQNKSLLVFTQCYLTGSGVLTYISANAGLFSFNKNWTNYLRGFNMGEWHFWLGLENVLAFNQMGMTNVELDVIVQKPNYIWKFGHENFKISGPDDKYYFTSDFKYSGISGGYNLSTQYSPEDILALSQHLPFSSPDITTENSFQNCAAAYGAGWWFNCTLTDKRINPLGLLPGKAPMQDPGNQLWLPGVNTNDEEFISNYQTVFLAFID